MESKTVASITTYNPNIFELKKNVQAIYSQVNALIIVDNNSDNIESIKDILKNYKNIYLIENKKNEGVAKAFNQAVKYSIENGYKYLLILDQDTTVPNNIIITFEKFISENRNIAIVCPSLNDINLKYERIIDEKYTEVNECISSASYINLDICQKIGFFDENMFIDWVDFEYCKRVIDSGYRIIKINSIFILHEVGKAEEVNFLWRKEIIYNHNPIRKYYYFRNRIYFAKKYNINVFNDIKYFRNLLKNFLLIFKEKDSKFKKIISAIKGIYDGINMKMSTKITNKR